VAKRAAQTLAWVTPQNWLLDIALDHLTLARCALYADLLQGRPPGAEAQSQTDAAVSGLRAAGRQDHLPRARLFRDRKALATARALIEECGYIRRLPELQDAEQSLADESD